MKKSVLFVCLGNICRSPAAEGIFTALVEKAGKSSDYKIDSAGTSGHHDGENADPRMMKAARKRGLELTSISRKFIKKDFKEFNYIIAMDNSNLSNMAALANSDGDHQKLLRMMDFSSKALEGVPDPYWSGDDGFEEVLDLLEEACQNLLDKIENE